MSDEEQKTYEHRFNLCKLVKEQFKPDIEYSNFKSRQTKKEHGFEICELPISKQWVSGPRRTGGLGVVTTQPCNREAVDGKPLKTVGSVHTHPKEKEDPEWFKPILYRPSLGDVFEAQETGEEFTCISLPHDGTLHCYGKIPKTVVRKVDKLDDAEPNARKFEKRYLPIINQFKICSTQVEKIGKLKRIKQRIRKPKRPPLRF